MKRPTTWMMMGIAAVVLAVPGFAMWEYHKQPAFCGTFCHIMEPYLASWTDSDFLARAHAEDDVACLDCHEATIQQQVNEAIVFVSGKYETPLQRRKFSDEWCLDCHEHGSYEQIIERTKDYTIDGILRNPHDPHPDKDESVVSRIECSKCHTMHNKSMTINYCYVECHHEYTFTTCGGTDCH